MKNIFWILKIEFLQNKIFFIFTMITSLFLGVCLIQGFFAINKVENLLIHEKWDAHIAVLPKGMNLSDLKKEIISGKPTHFLPEALYDTTLNLAQNQFKLSAILPITENGQIKVLQKGDHLGLSWLDKSIPITNWQEQNQYQTSEWGYRVVAALFASGPLDVMKHFKDLIDRKTIGQAYIIEDEMIKSQSMHDEMYFYLRLISILILCLFLSIIFLLAHLLKSRLRNVFEVLQTLGYSKKIQYQLSLFVLLIFMLSPALLGMLIGINFNPFL